MSEQVDVFLGFDPGGVGNFGWSVCQPTAGGEELRIKETGVGNNASHVLERVKHYLKSKGLQERVCAAGIDAPLFWNETGADREVDKLIRKRLPAAKKGMQQIANKNSVISVRGRNMWAGLLMQGPLLANLLRQKFAIPITESHPGALAYLDNRMRGLIIDLPSDDRAHERDATFAAYAAWRMSELDPKWRNLFCEERNRILPLGTPVSYWMPIRE